LIILGNSRGSFGPYNLRRRLRGCLVASDPGRRSLLAGWRSRPLDRRRYFRPGATGVGESDPVVRGRELQVLLEVIIHRRFLVAAARGQEHGTSAGQEQIG